MPETIVTNEEGKSLASEETTSNPQANEQGITSPAEGELTSVPEKFVGKQPQEIIKSYLELESHTGKIRSELAEKEKALEERNQRLAALETEYRQRSSQAQPANVPVQQQEQDPLSDFDKEFEANPKEAIRKGLESINAKTARIRDEAQYASQATSQSAHYENMKKTNPDFAELEPEMTALAQKIGPYLHPALRNSPQAIDMLYSLAKGNNVSKYVQREVEKTRKASNVVREEKRKAFSESPQGEGGGSKSAADMSLKELEALLGRSDK